MPEQNIEKHGSALTHSTERGLLLKDGEIFKIYFVNNKNIYCSTVLEHGFMD